MYTALKETETRATDLLPLWKLPFLKYFVPRFQKVDAAVTLIRNTTEELIGKCKQMVDAEEEAAFAAGGEEYVNDADPSVLRFLIASREEVTAQQLRDDLLSMLVAGHETTASVLTWTLYLLVLHPPQMAKVPRPPSNNPTATFSDCYPSRLLPILQHELLVSRVVACKMLANQSHVSQTLTCLPFASTSPQHMRSWVVQVGSERAALSWGGAARRGEEICQ